MRANPERGKSYDIFQEVGPIKNVSRTQYVLLSNGPDKKERTKTQ